MSDDARSEADKHFNRARDDRTASQSRTIDTARVKADGEKTARLKAERLAKAEADAGAIRAAGPHAKPELTNSDATSGAGSLPDEQSKDVDGGAG